MSRFFFRRRAFGLFKPSVASLTALGVLGTIYHTIGVAHADSGSRPENTAYHHVSYETKSRRKVIEPFPHGKNRDVIGTHPEAAAFSNTVLGKDTGIARIESFALPNKGWIEDFFRSTSVVVSDRKNMPVTNWTLISVANGFGGTAAGHFLYGVVNRAMVAGLVTNLYDYVKPDHETKFTDTESPPYPTGPSYGASIEQAIKEVFLALDKVITEECPNMTFSSQKKLPAIRQQSIALSGSSVLFTFYDSATRELRIALTGDSRAVLGRPLQNQDGSKSYEVHVLTTDQTILPSSSTSSPHASIIAQAKLPRPVSRAFGAAYLKWGHEIQQRLHEEYLGDRPFLPTTTVEPPYMTAEPVITSISAKPGDFLVLASGGLWESLTNEEAVGLLGVWVDHGMANASTDVAGRLSLSPRVFNSGELPVAGRSAKMVDDSTTMYRLWRTKKQFICVDHNPAMHLARNALGGADRDLTAALLSMLPPRAALFRDNIHATVVFFGD